MTAAANQIAVQFEETPAPGFYRLMRDKAVVSAAAINVDPNEHNLNRIASATLLAEFGNGSGESELQSTSEWTPLPDLHGRPLWGWFFALAMLAFGLELVCLSVWKR
jgi:hypothetical protein